MIELKDGMNWNNFLAELKPESWYKRIEGESNVDWIKRVAIKDSNWLEDDELVIYRRYIRSRERWVEEMIYKSELEILLKNERP